MVIVRCSRCTTGYRMDPSRVPEAGVRVRCPSCGHVFRVRLRQPALVPAEARFPAETPLSTPEKPHATQKSPQNPDSVLPGLQRDDGSSLLGSGSAAPRSPASPLDAPSSPGGFAAAPAPPTAPAAQASPWERGERTLDLDGNRDEEPPQRTTLETPPFRPGTPASAAPRQDPLGRAPRPAAREVHQEVQSSSPPVVPSPALSSSVAELPREHQRARRLARVLISDILVYNQEARDKALVEGNLVSALAGEVNKAWELYKSKVADDVLEESDYFKDALNQILAEGRKVF